MMCFRCGATHDGSVNNLVCSACAHLLDDRVCYCKEDYSPIIECELCIERLNLQDTDSLTPNIEPGYRFAFYPGSRHGGKTAAMAAALGVDIKELRKSNPDGKIQLDNGATLNFGTVDDISDSKLVFDAQGAVVNQKLLGVIVEHVRLARKRGVQIVDLQINGLDTACTPNIVIDTGKIVEDLEARLNKMNKLLAESEDKNAYLLKQLIKAKNDLVHVLTYGKLDSCSKQNKFLKADPVELEAIIKDCAAYLKGDDTIAGALSKSIEPKNLEPLGHYPAPGWIKQAYLGMDWGKPDNEPVIGKVTENGILLLPDQKFMDGDGNVTTVKLFDKLKAAYEHDVKELLYGEWRIDSQEAGALIHPEVKRLLTEQDNKPDKEIDDKDHKYVDFKQLYRSLVVMQVTDDYKPVCSVPSPAALVAMQGPSLEKDTPKSNSQFEVKIWKGKKASENQIADKVESLTLTPDAVAECGFKEIGYLGLEKAYGTKRNLEWENLDSEPGRSLYQVDVKLGNHTRPYATVQVKQVG